MQLNGGLVKGVRSARAVWLAVLFSLIGIVFIGIGIYGYIADKNKVYETTIATVTAIEEEYSGEDTTHYVLVDYTVGETTYHDVRVDAYHISWHIGTEIEILYNVDNPQDITTSSSRILFPIIATGLGVVALVVGVLTFRSTMHIVKRKPEESYAETDGSENSVSAYEGTDKLADTKLFFHFSGKLNQSYTVEDINGKVYFECKLNKFSMLGASDYEFISTENGENIVHKVGKTVTSSTSDGMMMVDEILSSHFKFDGMNCWDYVARRGYEIKHLIGEKHLISYDILRNNFVVARLVPASIKDPFNEKSMDFFHMAKGCYRIEFIDASITDIVTIAFIISRTEIVE